jgi:hypothetical protein
MTSDDGRHDLDDDEVEFLRQSGGVARIRVSGDDCPPFALIVAAAERVLSDGLQDRVSAHLAACPSCGALARDAADVTPSGLTAEEDARIVARLRGAWGTRASHAAPDAATPPAVVRPHHADRAPAWAPLLAIAATLVVAVGLGAWAMLLRQDKLALEQRVPRLQQELRDATAQAAAVRSEAETLRAANEPRNAQLNVSVIDLEPIAALRSEPSADRTFEVPGSDERVTLILAASGGISGGTAELHLLNEAGTVVWTAGGLHLGPLRTVNLLVPVSVLPNGAATLRLYTIRADGTRSLQDEYRARFVKR